MRSLRLNWRSRAIWAALLLTIGLVACGQSEPRWSAAERGILSSVSLLALTPLPTDTSNRVADNQAAIDLGRQLFFDVRLSGAGDQSCASCHQPERQFTDGLVTGMGVNTLSRNTPTIIGGAWQTWFYWDGRRDSLWAQAIIPIEAPDEMAGSRLETVRLMYEDADYRQQYEALFGPFPATVRSGELPPKGGHFTLAETQVKWLRLSATAQKQVNDVYAGVGKAIAAYERTLVPQASAFDRFMTALLERNDEAAAEAHMGESALAGARLFADIEKTGCLQCHNGALLTNGDFQNVGSGRFRGPKLDFGRMFGAQTVTQDPFNCLGEFSDADPDHCLALRFLNSDDHDHGDGAGAFKVPTLRNIAQTAPYFHDGRFATLGEVIQHYNAPPQDREHELKPLGLTAFEVEQLVAFLESLSSPVYTAAH